MDPVTQGAIAALDRLYLPLAELPDPSAPPHVGSAVPVVFQEAGATLPPPGRWITMRTVGTRVVHGQLQGFFFSKSKWAAREEFTEAAAAARLRADANRVSEFAPPDPSQWLTSSAHGDRPFSTLRQIAMDARYGRATQYRVLVRVAGASPAVMDMCRPAADCPPALVGRVGSAGGKGSEWVYTAKLKLEDATGELDASVFGAAGAGFFAGLEPTDLRAKPAAAEALGRALRRLMGEQRDASTWAEMCVTAHYLDPERPWESRRYFIFDTWMQAGLGEA